MLGKVMKDKVTGFCGTVTAKIEYIDGRVQCLIEPFRSNDGKFQEGRWFDENRLVLSLDE